MARSIPESDWKRFRALREVALERFCERVLHRAREIASAEGGTALSRYRELYDLVAGEDERLGDAFDNPRRSQALIQLAIMQSLGLLEPEELAQFSQETRAVLQFLAPEEGQTQAKRPRR